MCFLLFVNYTSIKLEKKNHKIMNEKKKNNIYCTHRSIKFSGSLRMGFAGWQVLIRWALGRRVCSSNLQH